MSTTALRPLLRVPTSTPFQALRLLPTQSRNARLLQRPKRPHLLDQIVILSDGSSYKQLTTSPKGVIRTTKDVRNHPIWNASDALLAGLEEDEAGKLKAFRLRYGRGFDIDEEGTEEDDNLMDLFSSITEEPPKPAQVAAAPKGKGKKGKK
ncbi:uncharacterized protein LAJ45_01596 [Morchella importuna]|nr:uncharacterized protein H6S33_000216 [Morchella sextelata]XP_045975133.1 uncharacterized protein LAJ45_01596 [Morchella importuna]KAH0614580.1 hypothetical protein H6S33_000216 [Morchella sextelata]KAH8153829.1 hypothetical protein LAJ45_01596 [Morchella importuna]